jgi:hypothetical protein
VPAAEAAPADETTAEEADQASSLEEENKA